MKEESTAQPRYFYPNKMGRVFLLAIEDVIGRNGLNAVLNLAGLKHYVNNLPPNDLTKAFAFEEFSAINQALEDMYGARGGRGLAIRAGRAVLKYALKEFGAVLGIADLTFRLMPLGMKMKVGLNAMAETFNNFSDQIVRIEEEPEYFLYIIERCPTCWGRKADHPICYAGLGLLQEGVHWVSGGKTIDVEEITCIAKGDSTCTYRIAKKPRD